MLGALLAVSLNLSPGPEVENTEKSLELLARTTFMNQIDAPSLALLMPILVRAWREKSIAARKVASQARRPS